MAAPAYDDLIASLNRGTVHTHQDWPGFFASVTGSGAAERAENAYRATGVLPTRAQWQAVCAVEEAAAVLARALSKRRGGQAGVREPRRPRPKRPSGAIGKVGL